jgi:hypothetical protein
MLDWDESNLYITGSIIGPERLSQSDGLGEGVDEPKLLARQRALGFCSNIKCSSRPRQNTGRYYVKGLRGLLFIATKNQSEATCPSCSYALFWSRDYEYFTDEECKEKDIQTIDDVYEKLKSKYRWQ